MYEPDVTLTAPRRSLLGCKSTGLFEAGLTVPAKLNVSDLLKYISNGSLARKVIPWLPLTNALRPTNLPTPAGILTSVQSNNTSLGKNIPLDPCCVTAGIVGFTSIYV